MFSCIENRGWNASIIENAHFSCVPVLVPRQCFLFWRWLGQVLIQIKLSFQWRLKSNSLSQIDEFNRILEM